MTAPISRRRFIVDGALATTGLSLLGVAATVQAQNAPEAAPKLAGPPRVLATHSYLFLNGAEIKFLEASVARLIPADALGPGALEAGCVLFIDRQLAGPFGRAQNWYMQGPWPDGDAQQGLQSRLTPAQTYRAGINAVNTYCRAQYSGADFPALTTAEQDALLAALEKGTPEIAEVHAQSFFALLLQNTIEGFFADPLYGGNRDMLGWKLIGFPGARYDYRNAVDQHGQAYPLPPVSIYGREAWG